MDHSLETGLFAAWGYFSLFFISCGFPISLTLAGIIVWSTGVRTPSRYRIGQVAYSLIIMGPSILIAYPLATTHLHEAQDWVFFLAEVIAFLFFILPCLALYPLINLHWAAKIGWCAVGVVVISAIISFFPTWQPGHWYSFLLPHLQQVNKFLGGFMGAFYLLLWLRLYEARTELDRIGQKEQPREGKAQQSSYLESETHTISLSFRA